ncbi:MAG TPA: PilT/PilU family type 4a pilus ATPase [Candidatus Acidoferrales bacterium]|nr:PilT/PilU family type 4a pilus ATPase [Candidatus Acidoferrales bacterium]
MDLTHILRAAVEQDASDIVLKDRRPPMFRVKGDLIPCSEAEVLTADNLQKMAAGILRDDTHRLRFATERHADLACDEPGLGRFRVHVFRQQGTVGIVFRVIPASVRSATELNLPPVIERLADERRGLILVTGTTGSGKTTTLASMIDHINQTSARHIVTVEDPIEYIHQEHAAVISQREIGTDVNDFPSALHAALRQNPDVVMVGEMRDRETIETAIMAAETGHLVMSTLHTADAPETILRTIATFPEYQREHIRVVLASVLRAVISQRLLHCSDGAGLVPAVEVMVGTLRVREYIEKQRIRDLPELIAQGHTYGMLTFDQSLVQLYRAGRITYADGLANCRNAADFEMLARGLDSSGTTLGNLEISADAR